jgi:hypothetical protein
MSEIVSEYLVSKKIFFLRGQKVMFSHDLAVLYGITTFNLNKAVQRNLERFPNDFMFQLSEPEAESLKFQIGISKKRGRGGRRRALPYAFTEHGVAMLSSVLRSKRAIQVNIEIMRAFSRLREVLASHRALARRLDALEAKVGSQDEKIQAVFGAIRELTREPEKPKRKIGFMAREKKAAYAGK